MATNIRNIPIPPAFYGVPSFGDGTYGVWKAAGYYRDNFNGSSFDGNSYFDLSTDLKPSGISKCFLLIYCGNAGSAVGGTLTVGPYVFSGSGGTNGNIIVTWIKESENSSYILDYRGQRIVNIGADWRLYVGRSRKNSYNSYGCYYCVV